MTRWCLLALAALLSGCGSEGTEPPPVEPEPACPELELELADGSCMRPGVPLDGCGEGFVHDGVYGCEPILPVEPCPPGLMAVPGDETCRAVMACGEGKWGDLPVEDSTQRVDGTYSGSDADGSETKPWPTIAEAVAAAAPGALVAVAAGTYSENVVISGKPVRLWGRCPELVAIEATGQPVGPCVATSLCLAGGVDGTEVGGLALRGAGFGIALSGSEDVLVDRVRVHDNASWGIAVLNSLGPTSVELRGSLIEQNREVGLAVVGSNITVDGSVVRTTQPRVSDQTNGRGINIQLECFNTSTGIQCDPAARSSAKVTRSLIEQNHEVGLYINGSDATVDGTVVRTTQPRVADQTGGRGITVELACVDTPAGQQCDPAARSSASVTRSLIEQNHDAGLLVFGSDATVDGTVVRTTLPRASNQTHGRGISVQLVCSDTPTGVACDPAARSSASVTRSLIETNHEFGLFVPGSDATVAASVVRGTVPAASDGRFGDGIAVLRATATASATITQALIADNARAGLASFGASVSLGDTHIRCAAVALNGELYDGGDFEVIDGGGNLCGCPNASDICKLVSTGLEPPDALPTGN